MRERLIEILKKVPRNTRAFYDQFADYLLVNGVIVPPCKVGDKVAVKALCECVCTIHDNDYCNGTGAICCPFEDVCEYEDCDNANERVFLTTVESIYDNGEGWKMRFNDLCIEADFKDEGISFFVGENAEERAERALKGGVE